MNTINPYSFLIKVELFSGIFFKNVRSGHVVTCVIN